MTEPGAVQPRVTLALSSGMWLAMAHVGVLHALESAHIPIHGIAACSGGGLVGAMYAAGMSVTEMAVAARTFGWRDMAELRVPRMGFFSNAKLETFVESHIGVKAFADLQIPLRLVCCNLMTGEEVILSGGRVGRAVRATCTIPQLFAPVEHNGQLLCDGGVLNKVPTQVARAMGGDVVIAVDVGLHSRRSRVPTSLIGVTSKVMSLIAEDRAERERAAADVLVTPNLSAYAAMEFDRSDELVAIGRAAMEAQIGAVHDCIAAWHARRTWRGRLRAWWRGEPAPPHA